LIPDNDCGRHLMLLPTLACPASCRYCFGPREADSACISQATLEAITRWQQANAERYTLEITFHGGEPLVPGPSFYRNALPLLRVSLAPRNVHFAMQSNLWLLTDELCQLFKEYEVSLGTSLDGPEAVNDAQRGSGYFQKTMAGIDRARAHGLTVGCICTFTAQSAKRADEVFDFFLSEGLGFSIHAALPPLGRSGGDYALSPAEHGQLLVDMLDRYLDNTTQIRISTLDSMSRSISAGKGGICTFGDCLGEYLAVDPAGWIYPCQRLAGVETFRLGNVHDCPTRQDIEETLAWRTLKYRQDRVAEDCGNCSHRTYCRGGCPYGVLSANGGSFNGDLRDPHCPAYRRTFDEITDRALAEVFSEENMDAVTAGVSEKHGLLRKGKLIRVMSGGPHPQDSARRARQAVAAVALAVSGTPEEALQRLDSAGVVTNPDAALGSLQALLRGLDTQPQQGLLNAYLHVTEACNLTCNHCYAISRKPENAASMAVADAVRMVRGVAEGGFTKAVITGGEPLIHPQRNALLEALATMRQEVKPILTVMRTNLAYPLDSELAERLLLSNDEVVVSVDGDRESHDARRGAGAYNHTLTNLHLLVDRCQHRDGDSRYRILTAARITIAATLMPDQMEGTEGDAVQALGEELGLPVRFKPVLPLGRGEHLGLKPSFYSSLDDDGDTLAHGAHPASTCGLGMNLYIGSEGSCYPCYALMTPRHYLGNAVHDGLAQVLTRNHTYRQVTVDSNRKCCACALRYLCGGYCRAWNNYDDPNSPLPDCSALYERAQRILRTALEVLEASKEKWQMAGLPWPGH